MCPFPPEHRQSMSWKIEGPRALLDFSPTLLAYLMRIRFFERVYSATIVQVNLLLLGRQILSVQFRATTRFSDCFLISFMKILVLLTK